MRITVFIQKIRDTRVLELRDGSSVMELLKMLGISPSEVISVRNGKIVTEREVLKDGDEVKLLSVISGG
ncbi:MAG: MoaD/ThiS family protein [Thermoproteota archaeon]